MKYQTFSNRYLEHLGINSSNKNLALINEIQSKHIAAFSFNSLGVVLNQALPLETDALMEKIVEQGLGGYCFEHNKLLFDVLRELDFNARPLLARVVYNKDVDAPKTHRVTLLELNGERYIVDAGFGHYGARHPVKLDEELPADQGDATYRIKRDSAGDYQFQIVKGGDFFTLYRFDLGRYTEADCVVSHFYSHKYPQAGFVNNLVVSRKFESEIRSLRNHEYHLVQNGKAHITRISSVERLHSLLVVEFELDIDLAISEFLFTRFVTETSSLVAKEGA